MGTEKKRKRDIDALLDRLWKVEGKPTKEVLSRLFSEFAYKRGLKTKTVVEYYEQLVEAGLIERQEDV